MTEAERRRYSLEGPWLDTIRPSVPISERKRRAAKAWRVVFVIAGLAMVVGSLFAFNR